MMYKMKKNKAIILISIILVINMVAICLLGIKVYRLNEKINVDGATKYTMYVGLMATVPGTIFSVWHNISGAVLASIYKRHS